MTNEQQQGQKKTGKKNVENANAKQDLGGNGVLERTSDLRNSTTPAPESNVEINT